MRMNEYNQKKHLYPVTEEDNMQRHQHMNSLTNPTEDFYSEQVSKMEEQASSMRKSLTLSNGKGHIGHHIRTFNTNSTQPGHTNQHSTLIEDSQLNFNSILGHAPAMNDSDEAFNLHNFE